MKKLIIQLLNFFLLIVIFANAAKAQSKIDCKDINPSGFSKFFNMKVTQDISAAQILFPTKELRNGIKSTPSEDKIIRDLWSNFINWTSIDFIGAPIRENYLGNDVCSVNFNIIFDLNQKGFKRKLYVEGFKLQPTRKNLNIGANDFPYDAHPIFWRKLMLAEQHQVLANYIEFFMQSQLLHGNFNTESKIIPRPYRDNIKALMNTYNNVRLPYMETERHGSVGRYFAFKYHSGEGMYEFEHNPSTTISIDKLNSFDKLSLVSNLCPKHLINLKVVNDSFYETNQDSSQFEIENQYDSIIIYSKFKCFPDGKYLIKQTTTSR